MNKFIVAAAAALLAAAFAVPTFAQTTPGAPGPNPPAATSPPAPIAPSTPLGRLH